MSDFDSDYTERQYEDQIADLRRELAAKKAAREKAERERDVANSLYAKSVELRREVERERDALAAALDRALKLGREMTGFVKSYGLDDAGPQSEWSRWLQCKNGLDNEADPSAILHAHDAALLQPAIEALTKVRGLITHDANGYEAHDVIDAALAKLRKEQPK